MKKVDKTIRILSIALLALVAISCNDGKKETSKGSMTAEMHQEEEHNHESSHAMATNHPGDHAADVIIDNYLKVKNALVADDHEEAARAGGRLVADFEAFDKSGYSSEEQKELTDIIEDAIEHAEHISESPIDHQREHFDILSKDVIDLIAITGTEKKLYQDFCSMYNNNKGAQWLSESKEIENPYFGDKMMNCGEVQREIN